MKEEIGRRGKREGRNKRRGGAMLKEEEEGEYIQLMLRFQRDLIPVF